MVNPKTKKNPDEKQDPKPTCSEMAISRLSRCENKRLVISWYQE